MSTSSTAPVVKNIAPVAFNLTISPTVSDFIFYVEDWRITVQRLQRNPLTIGVWIHDSHNTLLYGYKLQENRTVTYQEVKEQTQSIFNFVVNLWRYANSPNEITRPAISFRDGEITMDGYVSEKFDFGRMK